MPPSSRQCFHAIPAVLALLAGASMPGAADAQTVTSAYPSAVIRFLDTELPLMDTAVAAKDRSYFQGSNQRMVAFLDRWGLKSDPSVLEAYSTCTDAVTDFQIVGLCKISPPGTICDPASFFPKFDRNLAQCRKAAGVPK